MRDMVGAVDVRAGEWRQGCAHGQAQQVPVLAQAPGSEQVRVRGRFDSFRGEMELVLDSVEQIWPLAKATPLRPLPVTVADIAYHTTAVAVSSIFYFFLITCFSDLFFFQQLQTLTQHFIQ